MSKQTNLKPRNKEENKQEELFIPEGFTKDDEVEISQSSFWNFDDNPVFSGELVSIEEIKFNGKDEPATKVYIASEIDSKTHYKMPTNYQLSNKLSQLEVGKIFTAVFDGERNEGSKRIKDFRVFSK